MVTSAPTSPARPLIAFFTLTYAITWGLILAFLASKEFRLDAISMSDGFVMFLCMLAGPSVSGIVMTRRLDGRAGLSALADRARRWRVPRAWLAVALLTNLVVLLVILTTLAVVVSPDYAPGWQPVGLIIGLMAGCIEELGWTGFATYRMMTRWSPLRTGVVLGLIWATWHALADFAGNSAAMGTAWLPYFLIYWVVTLTAYRVLMTFAYAHTRSLLVAMLMHASYTGWQFTLSPATSTEQSIVWQAMLAASLVAIAAGVAFRERQASTGARHRTLAVVGGGRS